MDGRRFDDVMRSASRLKSRREVIKGLAGAALAGAVVVRGAASAGAAPVSCNSSDKCEAKCGTEQAICCNGQCIHAGCGPDRALNQRTCQCVLTNDDPRRRKSIAPKYCGA